ncbi:MAG: GTPase ObgE [Oscillospiraceae bacterium]|jgi:GTP-binding protein|nr:GTPase ObgE [Oscillospiraceae bacterium]
MFVDLARISLKAGDGGNGAVSFHREKYVAAGGPDGGDGGKGGDVVFVADNHLSTLADFRYKRKYAAQNGANGGTKRCTGRNAGDLVIKVPRGTLVKELKTGRLIADISGDGPAVIARGGRGGWGNARFASPTRQIPRFAKPGKPGDKLEVQLELKLLADVGLLGFPNVGKSSLLARVSEAKPEIANYHFTTLTPVLGVVRVEEGSSFVMADIPGLIEGASEGVGLGHAFLRHVDRCRLLVHIVDVSGIEGRDPREDFDIINAELKAYNPELAGRPMVVAAGKSDLATKEQLDSFKAFIEDTAGLPFFVISPATGQGLKELAAAVWSMLRELPPIAEYEPEPAAMPAVDPQGYTVRGGDGFYEVDAPWLNPVMNSVNPNDYESLQYFQRVLIQSGIIARLEEMGVEEGDTVSILGFEFDYVK